MLPVTMTAGTQFEVEGIAYEVNYDNTTVQVIAKTPRYSGDITLPSTVLYNGTVYIVTQINNAFSECNDLKSITLPATINWFSDRTLRGCNSLERINVESIEQWLSMKYRPVIPANCKLYFKDVPFEGDVTFTMSVPDSTFKYYNHFSSITFDGSETLTIGPGAFQCCTDLKKVYIKTACEAETYSFPYVSELYAEESLGASSYAMFNLTTPYHASFLYCGKSVKNSKYSEYGIVNADTVVTEGSGYPFYYNQYFSPRSSLGTTSDSIKAIIFAPSVTTMGNDYSLKDCPADFYRLAQIRKIYLGDTISTIETNRFSNCYFWRKDNVKNSQNSSQVQEAIDNSSNVIDFPNSLSLHKFTYSGKSPLETISFVNNTDVIDIKLDTVKCGVNVGDYSGIPFVASLKEWSCPLTYPFDYTIEKAPLTIMGNVITREYGQQNPELSCSYIGFVNGETSAELITPVQITTTATEESPVGTYPIILSNATSENYDITFERGTLNIVPASQTITWKQEFAEMKVGDIIELTATSTSGLNVSFSSSNTSVVDIYASEGKWYAECMMPGKVRVTATQSGDNNYNAANDIVKRLTVASVESHINIVGTNKKSNTPIYDLEGRKLDDLKQGVNVVNGKKVYVELP